MSKKEQPKPAPERFSLSDYGKTYEYRYRIPGDVLKQLQVKNVLEDIPVHEMITTAVIEKYKILPLPKKPVI